MPGSDPWVETIPGDTHISMAVSRGSSFVGDIHQIRPEVFSGWGSTRTGDMNLPSVCRMIFTQAFTDSGVTG